MGEISSPGKFYIQLVDPNGKNGALEQLTVEMEKFYSDSQHKTLISRLNNQFCVVRWPINGVTAYRRICISDFEPISQSGRGMCRDIRVFSTVKAVFVDYGYVKRIETKNIFCLDQRYVFCNLLGGGYAWGLGLRLCEKKL